MGKETKEVVVKEDNLPMDLKFSNDLMGATEDIDNEDIVIPKIHLMQSMSDLVREDVAKIGEFRNSRTNELLGTELEIFVFAMYKSWQVFEVSKKGKPVYVETLDYYDNATLQIEETMADGKQIHRDKVLGFFCLLVDELKQGGAFPYIVDFKRTSRAAGQDLVTKFAKLKQFANLPSYAKTFKLTAKEATNDLGSFFVKNIETGRNITAEELPIVEAIARQIKESRAKGKVKVDDSDIKEESKVSVEKNDKF